MDLLFPTSTTEDERTNEIVAAVLPIGSYEQHGPYLPLATDTIIASVIAQRIAQAYPVRLLPPITISCSHEHRAWPGTVSISARTLYSVVSDIWHSLRQSGVEGLVLINAHGGNYVLSNIVQESAATGPQMALFPTSADWRDARAAAGMATTNHQDMHAGELETSILLHALPDVVHDGYATADHLADDRTALLTLGMEAYTTSGVIGRPSLASAAKGEAALTSLLTRFRACLRILTDRSEPTHTTQLGVKNSGLSNR